MAKVKTVFYCTNCGVESPKWVGKCASCGEWNAYKEMTVDTKANKKATTTSYRENKDHVPTAVADIVTGTTVRQSTPDPELNRVLGGGIVPGSLVLIGGQPGIGKSTLLLQIALGLPITILYASGEESEEQIKMRADRIGLTNAQCYIYAETNVSKILKQAQKLQPQLLVVDSIQTLTSPHIEAAPGSISQVRECTGELQRFAKETNVPVFVIGHITKEGSLAGPKLLEHIVDVVLQFEGDRNYNYRVLRTIKNRFGSTDELGIYEMQGHGLRAVTNPSELLISQSQEDLSGSAIAASIEGQRPLLIETQALVAPAIYGTPQRSSTGFDLRRLSMLLAVIEKRVGLQLGQSDVYLNIAGGIKISDPAIDLAVIAALVSSLQDISLPKTTCFAGEVGLSGEIRAVSRIEQRIQEADRLGMETIYISRHNSKRIKQEDYNIEVKSVGRVDELIGDLFEW
jgi:DNA repair protein RadA/Sms